MLVGIAALPRDLVDLLAGRRQQSVGDLHALFDKQVHERVACVLLHIGAEVVRADVKLLAHAAEGEVLLHILLFNGLHGLRAQQAHAVAPPLGQQVARRKAQRRDAPLQLLRG